MRFVSETCMFWGVRRGDHGQLGFRLLLKAVQSLSALLLRQLKDANIWMFLSKGVQTMRSWCTLG